MASFNNKTSEPIIDAANRLGNIVDLLKQRYVFVSKFAPGSSIPPNTVTRSNERQRFEIGLADVRSPFIACSLENLCDF